MTHVLYEMFGWPSGNVIGNLLADGLTFTGGYLAGRRGLRRLRERIHETHRLTAELHAHHIGSGEQ